MDGKKCRCSVAPREKSVNNKAKGIPVGVPFFLHSADGRKRLHWRKHTKYKISALTKAAQKDYDLYI